MNFVLFDEEAVWKNFLPLTFTRPVSELRIGILTIREKWEQALGTECSYHTQDYLSRKFPLKAGKESVFINSHFLPGRELTAAISRLQPGKALYAKNQLIAFGVSGMNAGNVNAYEKADFSGNVFSIHNPWDLFVKNAEALAMDFEMLSGGRPSAPISDTVTVIGSRERVFIEEGAVAEACILNTTGGPVYLGKNSEVMEGAAIRGPFALGEGSVVKMNAKIYGATTIGPHCKMGGEISNSVVFGYSNKAHDGFLGNSVIGEWCNLGADTNNSNLKNNYANVKLYSYSDSKPVDTGLQFCGLIMGDHSKSGINTMFNTGTVAGVGCNIFGGGFPPVMIPSFSWGGSEGFAIHNLEKFFETAAKVYERRGIKFSDQEKTLLRSVFENTV